MNTKKKRKIILPLIIGAAFVIAAGIIIYFAMNRQSSKPEDQNIADLNVPELSDQQRFDALTEENEVLFPKYYTAVILSMANGPGKPAATGDSAVPASVPVTGQTSASSLEYSLQSTAIEDSTVQSVAHIQPSPPMIEPALPSIDIVLPSIQPPDISPTAPPEEPVLAVTYPTAGTRFYFGDAAAAAWTFESGREATFTVSLSTDGGNTFEVLCDGLVSIECDWTAPETPSDNCVIKVEAYVGDILYASGVSAVFTIESYTDPDYVFPVRPFEPDPALGYAVNGNFFINKNQDGTRWFNIDMKTTEAAKLVWQVSKTPFAGVDNDALDPAGLLASGELEPSQKEFSIDFNYIVEHISGGQGYTPTAGTGQLFQCDLKLTQVLLPQVRYTFYIRVIALDKAGNLIGDAGEGMSTGYGEPLLSLDDAFDGVPVFVQTWTKPKGTDTLGDNGSVWVHQVESGIIAHPDVNYWDFEFRKTPEKTIAVQMQVATTPFGTDAESYKNPQNLVYSNTWDKGTFGTNAFRFKLPLCEFVPSLETLGTNTMKYYVRMVFFRQSNDDPAVIYPIVSEVQVISYNNLEIVDAGAAVSLNMPTEEITVKSYVPFTRFQYYEPVTWTHPNADKYFEVSRRIMADEMVLTVHTPEGTIYPYEMQRQLTGMTKDQYQALLDQWLPVGCSFPLTIHTSAWSDFFDLLGDIYGAIQKAYQDLQDSAANLIADNFPFIGDGVRETLRSALKTAIGAGLTAIGLPPSLPNFEQLASEGFGYCLEVAIAEACQQYNIPSNEITDAMRDQITGEVKAQMAEIARMNNANPLGVGYLKPAAAYHYQPACIVVYVKNFTDQVSPSGTLTASFSVDNHFLKFYENVNIPVPELQPGSDTTIYYYMEPNIDKPVVDYKPGYDKYYYGDSIKGTTFSLNVTYNVPSAQELGKQQNLLPKDSSNPFMLYEYVYDHSPTYSFTSKQLPCEYILADESVDIMDFYE